MADLEFLEFNYLQKKTVERTEAAECAGLPLARLGRGARYSGGSLPWRDAET